MSESFVGVIFREWRKERHAEWRHRNLEVLRASGFNFDERAETCLFRGRVKADFYPSTGRWRVVDVRFDDKVRRKTFRGGAEAFLKWYARASP